MFHEGTQSDAALFKRLCPPGKDGKRQFAAVMLKRLRKLGIQKSDPAELTDGEVSKFVRLDIDPSLITWNRVVDTNDRFVDAGSTRACNDFGIDFCVAYKLDRARRR